MTYTFGSKIHYQTIFDINDTAIVSFFINDLIFTCGHCLPEVIKFKDTNLSLVSTSGFDNDNEGLELGIIKISNSQLLSNSLNIKLPLKQLSFSYLHNDIFHLICDNTIYPCNYLTTFNNDSFNNLTKFQLNKIKLCDQYTLYFDHQITKLDLDSNYLNLIKMNKIILYKSNYFTKNISEMNNKHFEFKLKTNVFHYLTRSSFSGSPIINNDNIFIGYHIGSTFGFILDELDSKICWIGNISYCKVVDFI